VSAVRDTLDMAGRQSAAIGSDAACDLVLADAAVAPAHARIENRDGRYTVAPVGPAHVLVNGRAVAAATVLYANDRIRLGPFTLVYEQGVIAPDPSAPRRRADLGAGEARPGGGRDHDRPRAGLEGAAGRAGRLLEHAVVQRHGDTAVLRDLRTPGWHLRQRRADEGSTNSLPVTASRSARRSSCGTAARSRASTRPAASRSTRPACGGSSAADA